MGQVLSIKFLSLKMSGEDAVAVLLCASRLRRDKVAMVASGKFGIRRRIFVIISPATLATLVGHLRGEERKVLRIGAKRRKTAAGSP